jgi:hypothetical protein
MPPPAIEANPALDQTPGHQTAFTVGFRDGVVETVKLLGSRVLIRQIENVARRQLHARRQFVAGDSAVESLGP